VIIEETVMITYTGVQ